jgi:hypothetical protein
VLNIYSISYIKGSNMRITQHFGLNQSQYELDFIDIDTDADLPLFIDPYFLSIRNDKWSMDATRTVRSFFSYFVTLVRSGNNDQARELFSHLHEPNETCLGMSVGIPSGRGIGTGDADDIFESIIESRAISTGVLEHLEDTRIFVENIGKDKISDMTTNIIKKHLIEYTKNQCQFWNIELTSGVTTGDVWDSVNRCWDNYYDDMLVINGKKILLVPKAIVSYSNKYTSDYYRQHFVLNFLQNEHLSIRSALVQRKIYKDGTFRDYVTKKMIKENTDLSKEYLKEFTSQHPEIFRNFKQQMKDKIEVVAQYEYANEDIYAVIDYLSTELQSIISGGEEATRYHKTVSGIMEIIFYPYLVSPMVENEIHDGRKRIDITFDNASETGFFYRLSNTYGIPSQFIHVECKNYSRDIANPELDQIAGRFSPNRGKFGFILCRSIDNMERFVNRCSDTYHDDRGLIFPLVDVDLIYLMNEIKEGRRESIDDFLMNRFRSIGLT